LDVIPAVAEPAQSS